VDLEINGVSLHCETFGEGEPLLWLHGFGGCGADWKYVFNEPPTGYRLIAPDSRGHGASTNSTGGTREGRARSRRSSPRLGHSPTATTT
jgi:pimeloyl-ACP methyl ester carboxylesterase